jgi:HK97 family phage portal protein
MALGIKFLRNLTRGGGQNVETRSDLAASIEERLVDAILGRLSTSGVRVTPLKAMGVATVFSCVNVIAKTVATLPLKVYRRRGDSREEAYDHPAYDLLHNAPNDDMTSYDFRMAVTSSLVLRGTGYAQVRRDQTGGLFDLTPVDYDRVKLEVGPQDSIVYRVDGINRPVSKEEMLHLKGYTRNGFIAEDSVNLLSDVIGLAIALDQSASAFFRNGQVSSAVLEHPSQLSDKAYTRLKEEFKDRYSGVANHHKTPILEEGMTLKTNRANNTDSQFDETRIRQAHSICGLYGVPPHKVGLVNNQPRANVEEENSMFTADTIRPICVIWEQVLNQRLFSPQERRELYVEYDLSGMLRGNLESRYKAYAIGRQWGLLSANDCRRKENLNSIGEKNDVYLTPLNMIPAGTEQSPNENN